MTSSLGKKSSNRERLRAAATILRWRRQSSPSAAKTPLSFSSVATDSSVLVRRNAPGRWTRILWIAARSETTATSAWAKRIR